MKTKQNKDIWTKDSKLKMHVSLFISPFCFTTTGDFFDNPDYKFDSVIVSHSLAFSQFVQSLSTFFHLLQHVFLAVATAHECKGFLRHRVKSLQPSHPGHQLLPKFPQALSYPDLRPVLPGQLQVLCGIRPKFFVNAIIGFSEQSRQFSTLARGPVPSLLQSVELLVKFRKECERSLFALALGFFDSLGPSFPPSRPLLAAHFNVL